MEIFDCHPLFHDLQMGRAFPDGKTLVDCTPKKELSLILQDYLQQKDQPGFDLAAFARQWFTQPVAKEAPETTDSGKDAVVHINNLWPLLTREPDEAGGSLIPLPFPYIVPGGRFGEIYYWDSYFTLLGLQASGNTAMIENMVRNFDFLIKRQGYIPNGNRSYYIGRSQPPFYSLMVRLLADQKGEIVMLTYLDSLRKEYDYWMKGAENLSTESPAINKVVLLETDCVLNRYCDAFDTPRPESYREDYELAEHSNRPANELFSHLRAGAESGWDYSSRWFANPQEFSTIHTTDIIPCDLNALLYHHEQTLAAAYHLQGQKKEAVHFEKTAEKRKQAIRKYCWNESLSFFGDYDFTAGEQKTVLHAGGMVPLFLNIATADEAEQTAIALEHKLLTGGGVVTTLHATGQQWDFPNGWAPLQWMAVKGLENYGYTELAKNIAQRWIKLNNDVFLRTGKLMEKYNVVDTHLEAGGGEYPGQDGFGWTNGVLLALIKKYGKPE